MTGTIIERRRSGWDIALGLLLIVGGLVILGHVVLATAVSILFLGWFALTGGIVALLAALFSIGRGGFWPSAVTGGLLLVLGLMLLRNPGAAALTLTLIAGSLFLVGGVVRLVMAFDHDAPRAALIFSGLVSLVLGLIVLFNLVDATFTLLGVLLGVQVISDGIMLLLFGRVRVSRWADAQEGFGTPAARS